MAAAATAGGRKGSKGDGVCGEKADGYSKASVSNVFQVGLLTSLFNQFNNMFLYI